MASSRTPISSGPLKGLAAIPVRHGPVAASETVERGAPLVLDANGRLTEGGVNPSNIVGFAVHDLTSAAVGTDIMYIPSEGNVFEGSVDNTAAGTGTIAQTDLGAQYGLTVDASNTWYVDKDKTGVNARVRIVAFRDAVAEVMGRVYFEVL